MVGGISAHVIKSSNVEYTLKTYPRSSKTNQINELLIRHTPDEVIKSPIQNSHPQIFIVDNSKSSNDLKFH